MKPVRLLLLILALLIAPRVALAQPQPGCESPAASDRVALVVGNGVYGSKGWPVLSNARSDTDAVCRAFAAQGFRVIRLEDGGREAMAEAIGRFAEAAASADTALFYFAGHGFEYAGTNYLVPADAPNATSRGQLAARFIDLGSVLRAVMQARHSLVFLDACRTRDPVVRIADADPEGPEGPAATINLPGNFEGVVFYSTARGKPAFDAAPAGARNSPFAEAVAQRLATPDLELSRYFAFVRSDVKAKTVFEAGGPQVPTPYGVFADEYYFARSPSVEASAGPTASPEAEAAVAARETMAREIAAREAMAREMAEREEAARMSDMQAAQSQAAHPASAGGDSAVAASSVPRAQASAASGMGRMAGFSGRARTGAVREGGPGKRLAGFDPGKARAALAGIGAEALAREDQPQLIGRVLATADAGSLAGLAASGDAQAQVLYGNMLAGGIGVRRDLAGARGLLAAAAASGLAAAQFEYARFLEHSGDGAADQAMALTLLEQAAAAGHVKAQGHLAQRLWTAAPPERDRKRAYALWEAASAAGDPEALLASARLGGRTGPALARLRAIGEAGNRDADGRLCELAWSAGRAARDFAACLRAAQDGQPASMAVVARLYADARRGPQGRREARYWAQLAAAQPGLDPGYRSALQTLLGSP